MSEGHDYALDVWDYDRKGWVRYGWSRLWDRPTFEEMIKTRATGFDGESFTADFWFQGGYFRVRGAGADGLMVACLVIQLRPDLVKEQSRP